MNFCNRNAKYIPLCLDWVLLTISVIFSSLLFLNNSEAFFSADVVSGIVFLELIWMCFAYSKSLYHRLLTDNAEVIVRVSVKTWLFYILVCSLLYFLLLKNIFTGKLFYTTLFLFGFFLFCSRVVFLSFRKKFRHLFVRRKKAVIIGYNGYNGDLQHIINDGFFEYKITGRYQEDEVRMKSNGSDYSDIYEMYREGVEEIFCCLSAMKKESIQQLLYEADQNMIRVKFFPEFEHILNRPVLIDRLGNTQVITVRKEPLLSEYNIIIKRAFDICFSLMVIVFILSWLVPLLALLIKAESRGPIFFKQKRSGRNNQPFYCYKFRSMKVNQHSDKVQASKQDARITKVGAFLRRTSLDELPQFFNVLRGDMSIVGPRPHMLLHTDQYRGEVNAYMIRHFVKPGITGWAQVNGYRGETRDLRFMQSRVEHDIAYLENWTFMLDMKIIFLTVWNIFKGEQNAY
ncbi:undecaprenyl-phosphate glucose phosphotransferase [Niabella ginsenosidivorans]|uniref:Undecaprenyl-phosphate glucose phosphotransferase n=1 Tax=Niabella ginsenosidivorans TaxID=1176587 RepID=A0A1A9I7S9_9BACT|nr:undecaprenyl-phosphate glucose phosphotransferase [Niabella ginsenosidivorans]